MRVYVTIPDSLLPTLQDQARAAHRPPRYHLEWLIRQALQERPADERRLTDHVQDLERRLARMEDAATQRRSEEKP